MNMEQLSPAKDQEGGPSGQEYKGAPLFPPWAAAFFSAVASATGLSGLLYCTGFLAMRSHQSLWGFWSGPSDDSANLVSEGGRFLYYCAMNLIDLLRTVSGCSIVILGLLLCTVPTAPIRDYLSRRNRVAQAGKVLLHLLPGFFGYLYGWTLLCDLRVVLGPVSILNDQTAVLPIFKVGWTAEYFSLLFGDWLWLAVILGASIWTLLLRDNAVSRIVTAFVGLFFLATTTLLPSAYGRLVLQPSFQQVEFGRDKEKPVKRVLIRAAGPQWIVWNLDTRKTEVVTLSQGESVIIGSRQLLQPSNVVLKGKGYGKE
jgi:hypothetical protein